VFQGQTTEGPTASFLDFLLLRGRGRRGRVEKKVGGKKIHIAKDDWTISLIVKRATGGKKRGGNRAVANASRGLCMKGHLHRSRISRTAEEAGKT